MTHSLPHYQITYDEIANHLPGNNTPQIKDLREKALDFFLQTGFPTTRDEDWRYTSLRQMTGINFQLMPHLTPPELTEKSAVLLKKISCEGKFESLIEWVFINGQWFSTSPRKEASSTSIQTLSEALNNNPQSLIPFLNQTFDLTAYPNAFTALNSALMQNGTFIQVPENQNVAIHLIFLTTPTQDHQSCHLRNLIVLNKNAKATVIESYCGDETYSYLTNTVTEIQLGEAAALTHYKFQNESKKAFHFGTIYVKQPYPHSEFSGHMISLGGLLSRSDTHTQLDAPMTHCLLNGLYCLSNHQHMDHHTSIHHLKPHGTSQQFYKGTLDDHAHGVFNGKIFVSQGAQKTDSQQSNQNLLLSQTAEIDTKPQLEILADDVKCVHGATVGQLDEEAIFYLRSRGLDSKMAQQILTEAFFSDVIHRMPHLYVREKIQLCL